MTGDGDGRFPSSMRIKRRDDFRRAFRAGMEWKGACFSLRVVEGTSGPRIGIVVSRKFGNAVERNRVKRKIREGFRRVAAALPSVDIIILPRPSCQRLGVGEFGRELANAVREAIAPEVRHEQRDGVPHQAGL